MKILQRTSRRVLFHQQEKVSVHLSLTPLYLTPSASVDLGNTLRGQLKFSLRSADKGRGEGERGILEDRAERGLLISKLLSLFVPYQKEGDYADFDL